MQVFDFSIIISGADPAADDFESAFYDAGCDDALVCVQNGLVFLDFSRNAETFTDAVTSAADDIEKAGAKAEQVWT